ncbi:SOS response-associated peptidase family protein [Roseivirga sp. BDSF3-8]|uniref:SOS response-associated peptidase family protein n=1 Tax=Roseivirga sp. BDSF3-8 TaxID=3241598 RepID=UPI003531E0E6
MRFRYGLVSDISVIERKLQAAFRSSGYEKQFNASAGMVMPVVYDEGHLDFVRWGGRGISAVAATSGIVRHPRFRHAVRNRRCLVPANYWLLLGNPPYLMHSLTDRLVTYAGICNSYPHPTIENRYVTCYSIILCPAPDKLRSLVNYVPVTIQAGDRRKWLKKTASLNQVTRLLSPDRAADGFPVDPMINDPSLNNREAINPTGPTIDQHITLIRRKQTEELRTDRRRYKEMVGTAKERKVVEKRHES